MPSTSPIQTGNIIPLKRPRPVKSCLSCRSRKLKCDREQPCSQCIRTNRAEQCDYNEHAGSLGSHWGENANSQILPNHVGAPIRNPVPSTAFTSDGSSNPTLINGAISSNTEIKQLRARISRLEDLVHGTDPSATVTPSQYEQRPQVIEAKYRGVSNTRSLMSLFPDAVSFANHVVSDASTKSEFQNLDYMFPKEKFRRQRFDSSHLSTTVDSILAAIPSSTICEQYVSLYTTFLPSIYQILHIPTFRQHYELFWNPEQEDNRSFRAEFAFQLALVVVIGSKYQQFDGHGDMIPSNFDPLRVCAIVDAWLSGLDFKQRVQLNTLQTSCLLILCKRILSVPPAELWLCTGDLVRSALAIGLHRDPDELDLQIPPLQADLRRRLWYTIAELDVESSILCRMPSLVQVVSYSCRCPAGSESGDTVVKIAESPNDLQADNVEQNFHQAALAKSLPTRLHALSILTQCQPNTNEIRKTLKDLECQRSSIPPKLRLSDAISGPTELFNSIMLDMCYRRPMISLTTLGLQCAGYLDTKDDATRCIGLCMAVMSMSETLDPSLSDREFISNGQLWAIFQAFNCDDIIRAAYNACFCMKLVAENSDAAHTAGGLRPMLNLELEIPRSAVKRTIEDLIKTFVNLKPDLRAVLKQLIGLSLVLELTKHTRNEAVKQRLMWTAFQRVLQLCRERHAADGNHGSSGDNNSDSLSSAPTLDFDQFMGQEFALDSAPFGWSLEFSPDGTLNLPSTNG